MEKTNKENTKININMYSFLVFVFFLLVTVLQLQTF